MTKTDFYWLNENSRSFLSRGYLEEGQSAEERLREISEKAEELLGRPGFADKFYGYLAKGYISLASPVWANFGNERGLPISCFGSYIGDNMGSIMHTQAEVGMMSKFGGGTSGYFGELRGRGEKIGKNGQSSGSVHFMQLFDLLTDVVSQGSVRRGKFSPYLPIEHPDAAEFLDIASDGNPIQNLTHAVTVSDKWLRDMEGGDEEKRTLWAKVLQSRGEIGFPYIMFRDNANKNTVDVYKDKNYDIHASNLCSEIMLPSNEDWSFVCCLSSVNLLHYEDWKDTDLVETMVAFLDAVISDFCKKLENLRDSGEKEDELAFHFMERAYRFAKEHRAIGVGVLGWHSFLQSKMIPFESKEANMYNVEIFKMLKERAYRASEALAEEFGEPEVLRGYGRRNTTLMAVAPTTSSAFILGQVSQSIEPVWSNCYVKDVQKLKVTIKNPFLEKLLAEKDKNTSDVWESIRNNDGSVQHLEFLTDKEKEVFRTFAELDQYAVIEQAAVRQHYIDQAQSLNIMISPDTPAKDINKLYLDAWKMGIKTLYYQHSINAAQALSRKKICLACEA